MVLPIVLTVVALVVVVLAVRRLLVWAAGRGWIYYGEDRPPRGAGGMALMEWSTIFKPEVEYVIEEQRSGDLRLVHAETGEDVDPEDEDGPGS